MRREACGGCGSDRLEVVVDLGRTPLADRFPTTPDEHEDTWPLQLAVCRSCWLAQLTEVVPDEALWADYGFYSGTSPSKVAEHKLLAEELLGRWPTQARRGVVEVASNDGDLLRHFKAAGCPAVGIDPAKGPAAVARHLGLDIRVQPFGRQTAAALRDERGPAGLVIARNVAAHVADPHDFLAGLAELIHPDGIAVVEVQYLADLLGGLQFDHLYHEHRFFYSVGSLTELACQYGLQFVRVERTAQQGGSIRVTFAHTTTGAGAANMESLPNLRSMGTYTAFANRVDWWFNRLDDLLTADLRGQRLAGYGATAKSTTLLNFLDLGPDRLEYVEDLTPAKIGKFTPGTKIPVVAPGTHEPPDAYLLLAWNYLGDVLRRERAFTDGGGRFLVPIPTPVLL